MKAGAQKGGNSMELQNKIAVVTGAAQGIGRAIAERLAGTGAKVYMLDYNFEVVKQTEVEFTCNGFLCVAVHCDISDVPQTRRIIQDIIEREGRIDILINNAGIAQNIGILEMTEENWDRVFNINLRGPFFLTQVVLKNMISRRSGKIVNIASLAGERGGRFAGIHYSSSKGAIITMTKSLALTAGEYGITVNAIAPGLIKTPMGNSLQFDTSEVPMRRLGTPGEVADAAFFLVSDYSTYINGTTLDVNGGQFMR